MKKKVPKEKLSDAAYSKIFSLIKEIMKEGLWNTRECWMYVSKDKNYATYEKFVDHPVIAEQMERLTPYLVKLDLLINQNKVSPAVRFLAEKFKIDYDSLLS